MGGCCSNEIWDDVKYEPVLRTSYRTHKDVQLVCQELLSFDAKLNTPADYTINPSGGRLFTFVNSTVLSSPLFETLQDVQRIYHSQRGQRETYSASDKQRQYKFLDQVLKTRVMQHCLSTLQDEELFEGDADEFRQRLYEIWFHLWGNKHDTCAFEHVFVGERTGHVVEGLHNWVQFYRQQQNGNLKNYTPLLPNGKISRPNARIVTMSFDWLGKHKRIGSMFIGTTPAFEMAIYTYLFFSKQEDNSTTLIRLEKQDIEINMIKNGDRIITTYPEEVAG